MNQYTKIIKDSFVDYVGKTHYFVIAAISDVRNLPCLWSDEDDPLVKKLHLGISICNPEDKFDETVGTNKAIARAKNSPAILFSTKRGYINDTLVEALLKQEAEYIKKNPGKFIPGYDDAQMRYYRDKNMQAFENSMDDVEKSVVEKVQKDPTFLDRIVEYMKWLSNRPKWKHLEKFGK